MSVASRRRPRAARRRTRGSCRAAGSAVSPSAVSSTLTRLWSASAISPSRTSPPSSDAGPQTASADVEVAARRRRPTAGRAAAARRRRAGRSSRRSRRGASAGARAGRASRPRGRRAGARAGRGSRRAEELDPGRGELDRERHAVEPGADRGDGRGVLVGDREARPDGDRPGDEQPDRLVLAERDRGRWRAIAAGRFSRSRPDRWLGSGGAGRPGTGYSCSPRDVERAPGSSTIALSSGAARSRSATTGAAVDDLLEVVEDEQDAACRAASRRAISAIGRAAALGEAEGAGDPRRDEHRVADRLERRRRRRRRGSRPTTVAASWSESRVLPVPPGPGQRQQPGRREQLGRPRRARASRPTKVVSWVGRLFGRASSERSGGKSAGRPSTTTWTDALRPRGP